MLKAFGAEQLEAACDFEWDCYDNEDDGELREIIRSKSFCISVG